jgi:hypothetical protein
MGRGVSSLLSPLGERRAGDKRGALIINGGEKGRVERGVF